MAMVYYYYYYYYYIREMTAVRRALVEKQDG